MTTRIKFRDEDGDILEKMLLEDRPDIGPEIRKHNAPGCDAGTSAPLDLAREHCDACVATIAEQIGIPLDDVDRIKRWRDAAAMSPEEREKERITSRDLGAILDKIVSRLEWSAGDCVQDGRRIMVEVEPMP